MVVLPRLHGAQDSVLIGLLGSEWKVFADPDAGDVGRNRLELAAVFFGGVGLQIEGVQMRWPAALPDQDAGNIFIRARADSFVEREAKRTQGAQTQQVAASE